MRKYIKISEYCKRRSIHYRTAYKHFHAGKIPGYKDPDTKTIYVLDEDVEERQNLNRAALYSRVSSSENKQNLETQSERLMNFAYAKGFTISKNVKEIGSRLNDNRQKLVELLKDPNWDYLVVEHKDRLTRFGFNYLKILIEGQGRSLIVINDTGNNKEDLMSDFVSLVTYFCARLYGQRRNKRNTEKLIKELTEEVD